MASNAPVQKGAALDTDRPSFLSRNQFLIYRLFSLAGLIPVGGYMAVHLAVNATVWMGVSVFQQQVNTIHSLGILLPLVEWVFIFLPMLFHAVVGVVIVTSGSFNTASYPLVRNYRYTLQRATGMIAFVFIVWHLWHMHHYGAVIGGGRFDPHHAASSAAIAVQSLPIKIFYVVGVLACCYHLANGTWTAGITWGVWTGKRAQYFASRICALVGIALFGVGMTALVGLNRVNVDEAQEIEARIEQVERTRRGEAPLLESARRDDAESAPSPTP